MLPAKLRLTHVFLFGSGRDQVRDFCGNLLGMHIRKSTHAYTLFEAEGCILAVKYRSCRNMPFTTSGFTVFETSQDLQHCAAILQNRGLSIQEPIQSPEGGRIVWFSGPYGHLHCVWEPESGHEVPIAFSSSTAQPPRIAYQFLAVDDLEVAIPFYRDVLGLSLIEAREGLYALFNAGRIILGLRHGKDAGAGVEAESWTVFETDRCEEFYRELERFGALPLGIRSEPHGKVYWFRGPGDHIQCFHDPQPEYALDNILQRPSMSTLKD